MRERENEGERKRERENGKEGREREKEWNKPMICVDGASYINNIPYESTA